MGTLVLGQEQDRRGGKYSPQEAFIGEITLLNIWGQVLDEPRIIALHSQCDRYVGDVKGWPDFLSGIKGTIKVSKLIKSLVQRWIY